MKWKALIGTLTASLIFGCASGGGGGSGPGGGGGGICSISSAGTGLFFHLISISGTDGSSEGVGVLEMDSGNILLIGNRDRFSTEKKVIRIEFDSNGNYQNSGSFLTGKIATSIDFPYSTISPNNYAYTNENGFGFIAEDGIYGFIQKDGSNRFLKKLNGLRTVSLINSRRIGTKYMVITVKENPPNNRWGYAVLKENDGQKLCNNVYFKTLPSYVKKIQYALLDELHSLTGWCLATFVGQYRSSSSSPSDIFIGNIKVYNASLPPAFNPYLDVENLYRYQMADSQIVNKVLRASDGSLFILAITGTDSDRDGLPDYGNNTNIDILLIKLAPTSLDVSWAKQIGGNKNDHGLDMIEDGDYLVITGSSFSTGSNTGDVIVIKINKSDGSIVWQKYFTQCSKDQYQEGQFITKTSSGDYLITGYHAGSFTGGKWRPFILKISSDGSLQGGCSAEQDASLSSTDVASGIRKNPESVSDFEIVQDSPTISNVTAISEVFDITTESICQ